MINALMTHSRAGGRETNSKLTESRVALTKALDQQTIRPRKKGYTAKFYRPLISILLQSLLTTSEGRGSLRGVNRDIMTMKIYNA